MTEEIKIKERGSRFYLLSKILFCVIAFVFVIFTVLANMGGNSEFHRQSIEQFAAESTGYRAKIGMLVNMTYFPTISVDFEDMDLFADPALDISAAHIDKAQAAFSFWDVMGRTGKIKVLNFHGIHISPEILFDKAIDLKNLSIIDTGENTGVLQGQGYVGNTALAFSMDMNASGTGRARKYGFAPRRAARIELGDIKISAMLQNGSNPYLSIQELKIVREGKEILTGRIDISKRRTREITLVGELKVEENGSIIKPDIIFDRAAQKVFGTIAGENFKAGDFAPGSKFDELVNRFVLYLGDPEKDAKFLDEFFGKHEVSLDLKGATPYQGRLKFEDNTLSLSP